MQPLLLYITDTEGLGGAEGYLQTLLQHADRQRFRLALALPPRAATRPLVEAAQAQGVQVLPLEAVHRDGISPGGLTRSLALLHILRPALVHFVLAGPRRCAETALAAALLRVPRRLATFQLVTPVPRFGWLIGQARLLNRRLQFRAFHRGIAVSAGNRRLLVEQYGFPAARLSLIANGVDPTRFAPRPADPALRAAWGLPPGVPLIGMAGRLSRQKGHAVLFAALPQVWQRHPNVHVVLAGSGELAAELRAQAAQLDPSGRIRFIGQQPDMPAALACFDLFVLPSLYEGLSFAVLEALAAARPVVASQVDGTSEVITDGANGLLVSPGQPAPLAEALLRLLDDPARAAQLGQAARATVLERFTQAAMLEHTFALYQL